MASNRHAMALRRLERVLALVLVSLVFSLADATAPSPLAPTKCEDTCVLVFGDNNKHHSIDVTSDGECDDGGSGSEYHYCAPGTDCSDCSRG